MATLLENRTTNVAVEQEAERLHNAMIKERYRRLQNAEADQFAEKTVSATSYEVRASVLAPERPAYSAPVVDAPLTEQTPTVTEFVRTRIETPVFTTEKFNAIQDTTREEIAFQTAQKPVEMPAQLAAPTASVALEAQYSLSAFAKKAMAVFGAVVVAMLSIICVNTQIIQRQSIKLRNLEQKKEQLMEANEELQSRIANAKSEETILEYAQSQGMIEANR